MGFNSEQAVKKVSSLKVVLHYTLSLLGLTLLVLLFTFPAFAQSRDEDVWKAPTDKFTQHDTDPFARKSHDGQDYDKSRFNSELVGGRSGSESRDFFLQGSATSVFSGRASLTAPPKVHILNASIPRFEEDQADPFAQREHEKEEQEDVSELPLREQLKKKYGDPKEDAPVLAKDDAPAPMKAMMEAFEANDEELAYEYARQLVRFKRETVERAAKVVKLSRYAEAEQGYIPEIEEDEEADYEGLRYAAQKAAEKEVERVESLTVELDPKLQEFIEQAEAEETRTPAKAQEPQLLDERSERAKIRRNYATKVPLVRNGKLLVYVFFRPKETNSTVMLRNLDKVFQNYQGQDKVEIIALSVDRAPQGLLNFVKRDLKLSLPLKSGSGFAEKLRVRETPALLMVESGKSKGLLEVGKREWFHVDEMILMALGR